MKTPYSRLLFVLMLLPFFATAQSNYRAGYVVNSKGDTVKGFIDYQAWDANPTSISFKSTVTDREKRTFSMGAMRSFGIDGITSYQKFLCMISTDITDPRHVVEGRDTSFRIDSVFLKVLQKGKNLALYAYTDNLKARFYIGETPDYKPTELIYRLYIDREATNVAGNTVNENTYQKQLFALANKYNALDDKTTAFLENPFLTYTGSDLQKIVSRINHLSNADFEKKYAEHSKLSYYAGILINASTTSSARTSGYTFAGGPASSSLLPGAAIGIVADPNPDYGRVNFRLDLSISPGRFNSVYPLKVAPYGQARATFNQFGIYFNPHAVFDLYNSPGFKFYMGLGASIEYFIYSGQYFESQDSGSNPFFPKEPFYFNQVNVAFLLTAGVKINHRWEVYFHYFTAASTTSGDYFFLSDHVKQLGINYFFDHI